MFVNCGEMVGSDGPVDSVGVTCLTAGGLQELVVSLVVVDVVESVGYGVGVAGHGDGNRLGSEHRLH